MKKIGLYITAIIALLSACKSDDYNQLPLLNVSGTYQKNVVIENNDISVRFDVLADETVSEDLDILLSLNPKSTAVLNHHFVIDKSTLQIYKGESKTSGKVKILQENFVDGESHTIIIDMKSPNALFDTNQVSINITLGDVRQPRPTYCKIISAWGTYAGIRHFLFAGIDNNVPVEKISQGSADAAFDYTKQIAFAKKGETYAYTLKMDWIEGDRDIYRAVFLIDWNKDGDYADPGEIVTDIRNIDKTAAATPITGSITVPADAVSGLTGIRIGFFFQGGETTISDAGCGTIESGEIEDYSLVIE